ncbi:MAG: hypothetical protein IPJ97_04600 [Proteobacteria bacterium]|nr:hypothetical protein [Pseudomonadota bacterium]
MRDILMPSLPEGPGSAVIALGYAGWESGHLRTRWRVNPASVDADERVLFATPIEQR